jgi:predicted N-acetyltransferase YhbS
VADGDALTFRPARAADLPRLHALIESAYRGETARAGWTHEADLIESPRTSIAELQATLASPDERLLIATEGADDAIVGCVEVSRRGGGVAYLGLLTVQPGRQGGGLGRQLLAAGEMEAAQAFGARTIEMTVIAGRAELIAYYGRRGYAPTGERRPFPVALEPPIEFVVLAKRLG